MIEVECTSTMPEAWGFLVHVKEVDGETEHQVTVARADYERLTNLAVLPEVLVQKTFEFLLRRERKELILRQFELTVVAHYLPEFDTEMRRALAR